MISKLLLTFFVAASVFLGFSTGQALAREYSKEYSAVNRTGIVRMPASNDSVGQGEQMLSRIRDPQPDFLRSKEKPSPIIIMGVCRTPYGALYRSFEKGYGDCLEGHRASF